MLLHITHGRLDIIPCHPDRFPNRLWRAFTMQFKSAVPLEFAQGFMNLPEELEDRLVLAEHAVQSSL